MRNHEWFAELCALAAIGDLTPDQEQELKLHAVECSECRSHVRQFQDLVHNWLPLADKASRHLTSTITHGDRSRRAREAYFARARREGLQLTALSAHSGGFWSAAPWFSLRPYLWPALSLACVVSTAIGVTSWSNQESVHKLTPVASAVYAPLSTTSALAPDASAEIANLRTDLNAAKRLNAEQAVTIAALSRERAAVLDQSHDLDQLLEAMRKQAQQLREELSQTRVASTETQQRLTAELRKTDDLKNQLSVLRDARAQDQASVVAAQARTQDLSEQVRLQAANLEHERELLAAGRDIRDLISARNLHILDVHDFDLKGKAQKSFGRVFYTEGKSLIFYAYDLPAKTVKNAAFQAWGQKADGSKQAINLGLLYIDDQKQARWALRFDNPDVLHQIDSVFVTVEPPGGTKQPSGQKLLYAWLGNDPNHP